MNDNDLMKNLKNRREAYSQLYAGSTTLLNEEHIFFTERWLLKLVYTLYRRRLEQVGAYIDHD